MRKAAIWLCCLLLVVGVGRGHAQQQDFQEDEPPPPEPSQEDDSSDDTLRPAADALQPDASTQNVAQFDMITSIDAMCPELDARSGATGEPRASDRTTTEDTLNITCGNLRFNVGQESMDLDGDGDDDILGLELTDAQQRSALQSINGEELQMPQLRVGQVQDVQVSAIAARLTAIRAGLVSPGISLSGLDVDVGDRVLAMDELEGREVVPAQFEDDGMFGRLGVFATGNVAFGDKDATSAVGGFDFTTAGLTVGADYRVTDRFVVGAAAGYARFDSEFDTTDTSPGNQEVDSDGAQVSLFGSWFPTDELFFDAIANVGWSFYDAERRIVVENNNPALDIGAGPGAGIDTDASGDFDAFHYGFAGNAGYDVAVLGGTVTPLARLEYLRAEIDGYTEESDSVLALRFDDQTAESLTLNVGAEADYPISTGFGVLSPGVRAEWVHEFLDDPDDLGIQFANDPTGSSRFTATPDGIDQDYALVGAGLTGTFPRGWAAFVDYTTVVFLENYSIHRFNVGVRKTF